MNRLDLHATRTAIAARAQGAPCEAPTLRTDDLRAMRADVAALATAVLQLDLLAKRARLAGADEALVAQHVADVRARLATLSGAVAAHTQTLDGLTREARAR